MQSCSDLQRQARLGGFAKFGRCEPFETSGRHLQIRHDRHLTNVSERSGKHVRGGVRELILPLSFQVRRYITGTVPQYSQSHFTFNSPTYDYFQDTTLKNP